MIFVDEKDEKIGDENTEPDWNVWEGVRTEEVTDEEGVLTEVKVHCRKLSDDEIASATKEQEEIERQKQLQNATLMFVRESAPTMTDEQALDLYLLFEEWIVGMECKKSHIIRHNGELYRIGQDHTAQEQYKPGDEGTTALYSHIEITEEGYEVWKAWDGVSGIYAKDKVVKDPEDGFLYKSKIDNNVWGPPHSTPDYWELYSES